MKRKIGVATGLAAVREYLQNGETTPRSVMLTAVRFTLEELAEQFPGQSVEVRVPPAGAVQILEGVKHRRGIPAAIVEMSMSTWLQLVCGKISWKAAVEQGLVDASGERASLAQLLPLSSLLVEKLNQLN